jgi:hypothetical protein
MPGVLQHIELWTPPPHRPASVYPPPPPPLVRGGGHTRWVEKGWGVNILEDGRHSSVLYICKYFVVLPIHLISASAAVSAGAVCRLPHTSFSSSEPESSN